MKKKDITAALRTAPVPRCLEETKVLCFAIISSGTAEPRIDFFQFLSAVFRHIGPRLWGLHGLVLALICAGILSLAGAPWVIPFFTPLFALACLPSLLHGRCCKMGELEAAAMFSGAELMLAKLILAAAADLVCLTVVIALTLTKSNCGANLAQLVLYAVVPLICCVSLTLWCARTRRAHTMQAGIIGCVGASALAGITALRLPELYSLSMLGLWLAAFLISAAFFAREIWLLLEIRKEGKIYGIIA